MSSIDDLLSDIGDAMAIKEDTKATSFGGREKMKPRPPPQEKSPKKAFTRSKYHGGAGSSTRSQDDDVHEGPQNINGNRDRTGSADGSMDGDNSFDRLMNLLSTGDKEVDDVPTNIFSKQWTSGEPRSANRCHASPNSSSSGTGRYGQSSESKSVAMTTTSSSIGDGFDDDDDVGGGGGHASTQRADEKNSPARGRPRENKSLVTTAMTATSASTDAATRDSGLNVPVVDSGHSSKDSLISASWINTKKNSVGDDEDDDDDDWDNPDSAAIHSRRNKSRLGSTGSDDSSPGGGIRRSPTVKKHLLSVGSTDDADDSLFCSFPSGVGSGGGGGNENVKNSGKEFHDNSGNKVGGTFGSNSNMGGGALSSPTPMYYNRGSYYTASSSTSSSSSSGQSSLFGPSSSNAVSLSNNNSTALVAISHGSHSHSGHGSHAAPHGNALPSSMDLSSTTGSTWVGVGVGVGISRGGASSPAITSSSTIPSICSNHGSSQNGHSSSAGSNHGSSHSLTSIHSHASGHSSNQSSSNVSFKLPTSTTHSSTMSGPSSNSTGAKAKCIRTVLAGPSMSRGIRSSVFSKCACNHLRCLSCNFKVHVFLGSEWTSHVDYMFFRNNVPNESNLAVQLITSGDSAAYCCQCSWTQVSGSDERILLAQGNSKDPQWVCAGH